MTLNYFNRLRALPHPRDRARAQHRSSPPRGILWRVVAMSVWIPYLSSGEIGDRLEQSIAKHGKPTASLATPEGGSVYIFPGQGATYRETYDAGGICVESDFGAQASPPDSPEITVHVEMLQQTPESESNRLSSTILWIGFLALSAFGVFVGLFMLKRARRPIAVPPPEDLDEPPPPDRSAAANAVLFHPSHPSVLSENEMAFYKVLTEAVDDQFLIMAHVPLAHVINLKAPAFLEHQAELDRMARKYVDYVLYDAADMHIRAAIIIEKVFAESEETHRREDFLIHVLKEQGTHYIEIDASPHYSVEHIRSKLRGV